MSMPPAPDKFSVGQKVALVLARDSGWAAMNNALGVVVGPKKAGNYRCCTLGGTPRGYQESERYAVRTRRGVHFFREDQLRAIYDGEKLSTWERFERATGLRLDAGRRETPAPGYDGANRPR